MFFLYVFIFKIGRLLIILFAFLMLVACAALNSKNQIDCMAIRDNVNVDYYLQQIHQFFNKKNKINNYQLLAIRTLLKEGRLHQAKQQLITLTFPLNTAERLELLLLKAELALALHKPQSSFSILQKIDSTYLDTPQRLRYFQTMVDTGYCQPSLDLVRAYIKALPFMVNSVTRQQAIDKIWEILISLPLLQGYPVINADENILQGWLDLLYVYQDNHLNSMCLQAAIKNWQVRYPNNPASHTLPTMLSQVQNYSSSLLGGIALLLPLQGQAQVFSDAIRQGLLAAKNGFFVTPQRPLGHMVSAMSGITNSLICNNYALGELLIGDGVNQSKSIITFNTNTNLNTLNTTYQSLDANNTPLTTSLIKQNHSRQFPVTTPFTSNMLVKVYDTSSQPLSTLLLQAQRDGADIIIGPLLKSDVEQLYKININASSNKKLNILALNQPEHLQPQPHVCYFALSPENEARDAANHIYQHGWRHPLLLLRDASDDRIAKSFSDAWHKAGGGVVLEQRFGSLTELRHNINSGFGIQLTGTPVHVDEVVDNKVVTITGLNTLVSQNSDTVFSPKNINNDIDAVYIIATSNELALIKPMIDMCVSSRAQLALYASSRIHQSDAGPDYRLEMEGLEFSDIPLLTGLDPALLSQLTIQFHGDYSLVRLYAMGMDAWALVNHFREIQAIPGFHMAGTTGMLSVISGCVINRELSWLKYHHGHLVVVH